MFREYTLKHITVKLNYFFLATALMFTGTVTGQEKLQANTEKTRLAWLGEKVVGKHAGTINLKSGWINMKDNRIVSGEFLVDMTSIKSDEKLDKLDGHLKSDDFFGVDKYPLSKFEITESTPFSNGTANVKGFLTIKGITHPVEFKTSLAKTGDGTRLTATIVVDRSKYNVRYGSGSFFSNLGDKAIYDEFKLNVDLLVN